MNSMLRRFICLMLAFVLVLGVVPSTTLVAFADEVDNEQTQQTDIPVLDPSHFAGKKVSILGDSISTY